MVGPPTNVKGTDAEKPALQILQKPCLAWDCPFWWSREEAQ
jgi:hypothetical protein